MSNRRIEAAFASVKREDFLGRGPWQVVRWGAVMCRRPEALAGLFLLVRGEGRLAAEFDTVRLGVGPVAPPKLGRGVGSRFLSNQWCA